LSLELVNVVVTTVVPLNLRIVYMKMTRS